MVFYQIAQILDNTKTFNSLLIHLGIETIFGIILVLIT